MFYWRGEWFIGDNIRPKQSRDHDEWMWICETLTNVCVHVLVCVYVSIAVAHMLNCRPQMGLFNDAAVSEQFMSLADNGTLVVQQLVWGWWGGGGVFQFQLSRSVRSRSCSSCSCVTTHSSCIPCTTMTFPLTTNLTVMYVRISETLWTDR